MEEKTSVFSLIEKQASSLLPAAQAAKSLQVYSRRNKKKGRKNVRFFLIIRVGTCSFYGSAATPNEPGILKI